MSQNSGKTCCRLCLAPEDECVGIFKTQAADKQPIQTKINSCVQIQVSEINLNCLTNWWNFRKGRSVSSLGSDSPNKRSSLCARKIDKCQCGRSHARVKAAETKKWKRKICVVLSWWWWNTVSCHRTFSSVPPECVLVDPFCNWRWYNATGFLKSFFRKSKRSGHKTMKLKKPCENDKEKQATWWWYQ